MQECGWIAQLNNRPPGDINDVDACCRLADPRLFLPL
jgi:hypothetical protein